MKTYINMILVIILITAGQLCAAFQTANYHEEGNLWVVGGGSQTGTLMIDTAGSIVFEGATADAHETTIAVTDPTADRTITFPNLSGTVMLDVSGVVTGTNGGTFSNATNNQWILGENSEDLNFAFGSNAITMSSSTSVTSINWGTILPTFGGNITLQNGGTIGNGTDNAVSIAENSEDIIFTFSSNAVALSSSTGVADIAYGGITQSGTAKKIDTDSDGKTVLAAESGDIQYCTGAGTWVLPEASTVLGRSFIFVNYGGGGAVVIDPADGTDTLLAITNSAGDSITNSTAGNAVTLTAVNSNNWVVTSIYGTWADNN